MGCYPTSPPGTGVAKLPCPLTLQMSRVLTVIFSIVFDTVPCFGFVLDQLARLVCLVYRDTKALFLMFKEAAAMGELASILACSLKLHGELCAIFLLEIAIGDEKTVWLSCSHAFHIV